MANPEHVKIVRGGADAIREWRERNPVERFDLVGADLDHANLARVDLHDANLSGADLRGANLQNANLVYARLPSSILLGANLRRADLRKADLLSADLRSAILESADLRGAVLTYAVLIGTKVSGANFEATIFLETILGDVDFSRAIGLEDVEHGQPSVIDERTLRVSWPLPEVFLRGIGLSDQYIEYLPSLMGQAIEFYSCFISYSSKDQEFAERLHADLQQKGVRCWFAPEDLKIGDELRLRIDEAIRLHDKLLLILSEESVQSEWVEDEVERALEKEQKAIEVGAERTVLFPISLDSAAEDTDAAWAKSIRRTRHIGDFSAWKDHDAYQESFQRLLRDLKSGAKD